MLMLEHKPKPQIAPSRKSETYRFRDGNLKIIGFSSMPKNDDEAYDYAAKWEYVYIERCADVWPHHHAYSSWVILPWALDIENWEWVPVDEL